MAIRDLRLDTLQTISPVFENDVYKMMDAATAVAARTAIGGTAPESVRDQIKAAKSLIGLESHRDDDYLWVVHQVEQTTARDVMQIAS